VVADVAGRTPALGGVRALLRSHWHRVVPLLGLVALATAVWAWVGEGSPALAVFLVLQSVLLVGVALTGTRSLAVQRQLRRNDQHLSQLLALSAKAARKTAPSPAPQTPDLSPLVDSVKAQGVEAATRHATVMASHREVLRGQEEIGTGLRKEKQRLAELRKMLEGVEAETVRSAELEAVEKRLTLLVNRRFEEAVSENDALINLHRLVEVDPGRPAPGGFAASPRTLLRLFSAAGAVPAERTVVECGSGTSTVWMAEARRRAGGGRVVALEHDEEYAARTRAALRRSGLSDWAEVRCAPLEPVEIDDVSYPWYARSTWDDLEGIGLLFVDGPPASVGTQSRLPAFPLLADRLAPGATVALDDVQRPAERAIVRSWMASTSSPVVLADDEVVGRTRFLRTTPRAG
jgi:predicted O-methyltransferase YrrM